MNYELQQRFEFPGGSGQAVDRPLGPISLKVAADLVEPLAGVPHQLAGATDIGEVGGKPQQRKFATFLSGRFSGV